VESYCRNQGFELLPISFGHTERAGSWLRKRGDPFDRMLAVQGDKERIPVATNDPKFEALRRREDLVDQERATAAGT